jgi:hypothetical protein
MIKQRGFVLPFILCFMQMLVILSLSLLENARLATKINQRLYQKQLLMNNLNFITNHLDFNSFSHCLLAHRVSEEVKAYPLSWWEKQSCAGNFQAMQYYYVVEDLGLDPCAYIGKSKNFIANFYRISILGFDKSAEIKGFAKVVVAVPSPATFLCKVNGHNVKQGRKGWFEE